MFELVDAASPGFVTVPAPELELAVWLEEEQPELGAGPSAQLTFATRQHIFTFAAQADPGVPFDPKAFVLDLAARQIQAAGGGPPPADVVSADRSEAESELASLFPEPPPGFGLTSAATIASRDEIERGDGVQVDVAEFLDRRSISVTRLWGNETGSLVGAVNLTDYPYEIFAAAAVGVRTKADDVVSTDAIAEVPHVVSYVDDRTFGTVFRQGNHFVIVQAQYRDDSLAATAEALAVELTRATAASLPAGDSDPYFFAGMPSKVGGLAITAAIVTAVAGSAAVVARVRARRVRRLWTGAPLPPPDARDATRPGTAVPLDDDAQRLRRQGGIVAVGQLLTVNVIIVALAGDFAWLGVAVAVVTLIAGLLFTRWWQRRELGLLGAKAPPRELVLPRPAGAIAGVVALAVLGLGIAYVLKGLRYVVLPPSLAQLKWSDLLGIAPRTVGYVFGLAGFVVAMLGAWLFRRARAMSRARTKRVLEVDGRPAALYLRSFDDDSLPLPSIASARRPLFELFSLRGADPFEESVAWELNSYGPVVAVGRPGRSLSSLGAAREHLPGDTWREEVANRMDQAGVIAVATGETEGLAWELGQVVHGGHLSKTFFVFPPVAPDELGRRWDHTAASLAAAGQRVGPLPVPASVVHTARLDVDGTVTATFASRRDEATYRTAVDRVLDTQPDPGPDRVDPKHPAHPTHPTPVAGDPASTDVPLVERGR
jgi:hypothetical protein